MDKCNFISSIEGAMICLEGIAFPASKQEIVRHIESNGGPEAVIVVANRLPDRMYESMSELLKHLEVEGNRVQPEIPESLTLEHQELHVILKGALDIEGEVGAAARRVAGLLHPHFVKEEEFAMPTLGLLVPLSQGKLTPGMAGVLPLVDRLKADMPEMLKEHTEIVKAVQKLREAAAKAGLDEYVKFADKLKIHAQTEEEVLYPASILVGEYVRLRIGG